MSNRAGKRYELSSLTVASKAEVLELADIVGGSGWTGKVGSVRDSKDMSWRIALTMSTKNWYRRLWISRMNTLTHSQIVLAIDATRAKGSATMSAYTQGCALRAGMPFL